MVRTNISLDALPYEILKQVICDHLAPHDDNAPNPVIHLSQVNKYMRIVSIPELFKIVTVRGDPQHGLQRLEQMKSCPSLLQYTRIFKFDFYVDEDSELPEKLPGALSEILRCLPHLKKVVLCIPDQYAHVFEENLSSVSLPKVRVLVVGPLCEFAVRLCPNLTTLSTNGLLWRRTSCRSELPSNSPTSRLIVAAASAEKLINLNIDQPIEQSDLDDIFNQMPRLTHLGTVGRGFRRMSIWDYLPALSKFQNLTHLYLGEVWELGAGFKGGPGCGNAYRGPNGAQLRRNVEAQRLKAEVTVADGLFPQLRSLQELWIGERTRVQVLRSEDGTVSHTNFDRTQRLNKVVKYPRP